tara:strand:- start:114 stop:803 length:690 start_codon:yes stop_codon:yes gene_type:complete
VTIVPSKVDSVKLAFVHIPKTAGTTFRISLIESLGREKVFSIGDDCTPEEWDDSITAENLRSYEVICGHGEAKQFKRFGIPLVFATLLRDPCVRAASYYNFTRKRKPYSKLGSLLQTRSLLDALEQIPAFRKAVSNAQCTYICSAPSAKLALDEMSSTEWLVRDECEIAELVADVSARFGWNLVEPGKYNVARTPYVDRVLTPEARRLLEEINQEDLALLDAVKSGVRA